MSQTWKWCRTRPLLSCLSQTQLLKEKTSGQRSFLSQSPLTETLWMASTIPEHIIWYPLSRQPAENLYWARMQYTYLQPIWMLCRIENKPLSKQEIGKGSEYNQQGHKPNKQWRYTGPTPRTNYKTKLCKPQVRMIQTIKVTMHLGCVIWGTSVNHNVSKGWLYLVSHSII